MARIRSIKPEFWDDEKVAQLPRDVRLLYIGMWNFSDDFGVIKANPTWLKSKIFPYDDIQLSQFKKWLEVLERPGFISPGGTVAWAIRFDANGEAFYYLSNFSRHQRVERPSSHNRNPEPPKDLIEALSKARDSLTEGSPNPHRGLTEGSPLYSKVKEEDKEEESKDPPLPPKGERREKFTQPTLDDVREYCQSRKNSVDPEAWMSHYQAKGWVIGKNKMVDWQAAVRTWERNNGTNQPIRGETRSQRMDRQASELLRELRQEGGDTPATQPDFPEFREA